MPVPLAALQALLANVRRRSPSMRLGQAAELARPGNVLSQRETDDEAMLLVQVPGWSVPATAMLYPAEGEWACDCGGATTDGPRRQRRSGVERVDHVAGSEPRTCWIGQRPPRAT